MIPARRLAGPLAAVTALALLTGCTSSANAGGGHASGAASAAATASGSSTAAASDGASDSAAVPAPTGALPGSLYLSIGDSYAAGYQPSAPAQGATTRNGFAYQVVTDARAKGYALTLVNLGCAGATTESTRSAPGCAPNRLGPGATDYAPRTQSAAAVAFLKAHRGKVGLITVSLGGNDVTKCGLAANPLGCLTPALDAVKTNLGALLHDLRAAAGPTTRIVGITYPDVLLGNALSTDATIKNTASLSVLAFQSLINPALKAAYEAVGGTFVDVTAATGAYGPMTATTTLPPYGTVPVPVAKVCQLTYYCQYHDIHPRTNGYALIAGLVTATLPKA